MSRNSRLTRALAILALLVVPATTGAEVPAHDLLHKSTLIEIDSSGAPHAVISADGKVVFRNRTNGVARIVFQRSDAKSLACTSEGEVIVHAITSQFLLRRDAELSCAVQPGKYKYMTLTHLEDGIHRGKSTLRVRR